MIEIQSCQIELTSEAIDSSRWGGVIATYDVTVGPLGDVASAQRRKLEKSAYLAQWVKLDQFEACITHWKFENSGSYAISLIGGNILGKEWVVDVRGSNDRRLSVRIKRP